MFVKACAKGLTCVGVGATIGGKDAPKPVCDEMPRDCVVEIVAGSDK